MTLDLSATLAIIGAYLIGSISSAILISKCYGLPDPRTCYSTNPGATNMLRSGGRMVAAFTLFGDFVKAFVPVLLVQKMGFSSTIVALVGAAVFLGHLFPLYHSFRGGKGVATLFGCLCALSGWAALVWSGLWLLVLALTRRVAVASMLAGLATPVIVWWFLDTPVLTSVLAAMSLMLVWRHGDNIRRLYNRTENKF